MNKLSETEGTDVNQEIIDLVVARLQTIPSNVSVSIGNEGSFNIAELIERVRANDEIGKKIIEMNLAYIRSLKDLSVTDKSNVDLTNEAALR